MVEEVLDTDADAETVEVRRGLREFTTVLDWVTELVVVLEGKDDIE